MNVSLMIAFKGLAKCVRYTGVSLSRGSFSYILLLLG